MQFSEALKFFQLRQRHFLQLPMLRPITFSRWYSPYLVLENSRRASRTWLDSAGG